jgi:S1-C subfamily serine protease
MWTTWERRYARDRFLLRPLEVPQGMGSGFVWDERGYVVTNVHVLQGASRALITLSDGSRYEGIPVGGDADFDIAVLKIDAPRDKLTAVPIGTSKDLLVGQKVFAIGNPFGLDQTLTTGIISGLEREIMADPRGEPIRGVIQTDAAINPGNSGGPLLDSAGRLIGINTAIYSTSGASAGVGFAVPVDTVNKVVPILIQRGSTTPPIMGVTIASEQVAREIGVTGLVIDSVTPGSGAARAGLRSLEVSTTSNEVRADVIVAIEGKRVESFADIKQALMSHQPGDTVEVEILREGSRMKVEVVLQAAG